MCKNLFFTSSGSCHFSNRNNSRTKYDIYKPSLRRVTNITQEYADLGPETSALRVIKKHFKSSPAQRGTGKIGG